MAYYERSYYREEGGPGPGSGGRRVVYWLLGINVAIWLLDQIFTGSARGAAVSPYFWLNYNIAEGLFGGEVWRFFTYQFVHSPVDFLHIVFNMLILVFLGPMMESWWGGRKFLAFYLLCGVCGAAAFTALWFVPGLLGVHGQAPLVGASGSIYGILIGCAKIYPQQQIRLLLPPVELRLRTLCYVLLGLAVAKVVFGSANAGGEAAHLGGMLLGWVLVRHPGLLNFAEARFWDLLSPARLRGKMREKSEIRRQARAALSEKEIDRILEKVHREGLASLTNREKKTLQQATERERGR